MANLISLSAYKLVVMYTQQINYLNGQKSGARVFWRNVNIIVSLVHRPSIKDSELLVLPYIPLLFLQLFVSTSYYIICACVCSCCSESTMPYTTHIGTYISCRRVRDKTRVNCHLSLYYYLVVIIAYLIRIYII